MRILFGIGCLAVLLTVQPLAAGPIQYIESGEIVSGSLNGVTLTDVSYVFTLDADTSNIYLYNGTGPLLNPAITNTIEIGALNGSFTDTMAAGVNPTGGYIGMSVMAGSTLTLNGITLGPVAGAIGYGLATSIGPLTAATGNFNGSSTFDTTLGPLVVTDLSDLSFQAIASSAPEPATLWLSAFALLGIALAGTRKAR